MKLLAWILSAWLVGYEASAALSSETTRGAYYIGEQQHGKRHGIGKEYRRTGEVYDGEWLHDKKHGVGTEHFNDGSIRYKGEWQHGKRHGLGALYNSDHELLYAGEWRKGEQTPAQCPRGIGAGAWDSCVGVEEYADGSYYHGLWHSGAKHGEGIIYSADGEVLRKGRWVYDTYIDPTTPRSNEPDDMSHELRRMKSYTECRVYDEIDDEIDGKLYDVTEYYADGTIRYKGTHKVGVRHGKGTEYYPNGNVRYHGEYSGGRWNGWGTSYMPDGQVSSRGEWSCSWLRPLREDAPVGSPEWWDLLKVNF